MVYRELCGLYSEVNYDRPKREIQSTVESNTSKPKLSRKSKKTCKHSSRAVEEKSSVALSSSPLSRSDKENQNPPPAVTKKRKLSDEDRTEKSTTNQTEVRRTELDVEEVEAEETTSRPTKKPKTARASTKRMESSFTHQNTSVHDETYIIDDDTEDDDLSFDPDSTTQNEMPSGGDHDTLKIGALTDSGPTAIKKLNRKSKVVDYTEISDDEPSDSDRWGDAPKVASKRSMRESKKRKADAVDDGSDSCPPLKRQRSAKDHSLQPELRGGAKKKRSTSSAPLKAPKPQKRKVIELEDDTDDLVSPVRKKRRQRGQEDIKLQKKEIAHPKKPKLRKLRTKPLRPRHIQDHSTDIESTANSDVTEVLEEHIDYINVEDIEDQPLRLMVEKLENGPHPTALLPAFTILFEEAAQSDPGAAAWFYHRVLTFIEHADGLDPFSHKNRHKGMSSAERRHNLELFPLPTKAETAENLGFAMKCLRATFWNFEQATTLYLAKPNIEINKVALKARLLQDFCGKSEYYVAQMHAGNAEFPSFLKKEPREDQFLTLADGKFKCAQSFIQASREPLLKGLLEIITEIAKEAALKNLEHAQWFWERLRDFLRLVCPVNIYAAEDLTVGFFKTVRKYDPTANWDGDVNLCGKALLCLRLAM